MRLVQELIKQKKLSKAFLTAIRSENAIGLNLETRLAIGQIIKAKVTEEDNIEFVAELADNYKTLTGKNSGLITTTMINYFRVSYKNEVKLYKELEV